MYQTPLSQYPIYPQLSAPPTPPPPVWAQPAHPYSPSFATFQTLPWSHSTPGYPIAHHSAPPQVHPMYFQGAQGYSPSTYTQSPVIQYVQPQVVPQNIASQIMPQIAPSQPATIQQTVAQQAPSAPTQQVHQPQQVPLQSAPVQQNAVQPTSEHQAPTQMTAPPPAATSSSTDSQPQQTIRQVNSLDSQASQQQIAPAQIANNVAVRSVDSVLAQAAAAASPGSRPTNGPAPQSQQQRPAPGQQAQPPQRPGPPPQAAIGRQAALQQRPAPAQTARPTPPVTTPERRQGPAGSPSQPASPPAQLQSVTGQLAQEPTTNILLTPAAENHPTDLAQQKTSQQSSPSTQVSSSSTVPKAQSASPTGSSKPVPAVTTRVQSDTSQPDVTTGGSEPKTDSVVGVDHKNPVRTPDSIPGPSKSVPSNATSEGGRSTQDKQQTSLTPMHQTSNGNQSSQSAIGDAQTKAPGTVSVQASPPREQKQHLPQPEDPPSQMKSPQGRPSLAPPAPGGMIRVTDSQSGTSRVVGPRAGSDMPAKSSSKDAQLMPLRPQSPDPQPASTAPDQKPIKPEQRKAEKESATTQPKQSPAPDQASTADATDVVKQTPSLLKQESSDTSKTSYAEPDIDAGPTKSFSLPDGLSSPGPSAQSTDTAGNASAPQQRLGNEMPSRALGSPAHSASGEQPPTSGTRENPVSTNPDLKSQEVVAMQSKVVPTTSSALPAPNMGPASTSAYPNSSDMASRNLRPSPLRFSVDSTDRDLSLTVKSVKSSNPQVISGRPTQAQFSHTEQDIDKTDAKSSEMKKDFQASTTDLNSGFPRGPNSPTSRRVFGVSLDDLFTRDGDPLPSAVKQMIESVDIFGLGQPGIYGVSASPAKVNPLKGKMDKGISFPVCSQIPMLTTP